MAKFNLTGMEEVKEAKKSVAKTEKKEAVIIQTPSGISGTRGRKGMKLPTMNVRFSEENYAYLRKEAPIRGLSMSAFLNLLIEKYRSNPKHVHDIVIEDDEW